MGNSIKKVLSVFLCLVFLLGASSVGGEGIAEVTSAFSIQANAENSIDNKLFINKLKEEKNKFRQGEYFCGNNNANSVPSKRSNLTESSPVRLCNDHYTENTYCTASCKCECGAYYIGNTACCWQCYGYACQLGFNIFGIDPYNGWGSSHFNADDILPGDHIRFSWYKNNSDTLHSIFVTDVIGDDIYFTDANFAGTCKIRWDAAPMKRSTVQALLNNYSGGGCGIHRAPNNTVILGEHGVDSFPPEIKNIEAVSDGNHTGFTINFKATDDLGVAKVSAIVWGATQSYNEAKSKGQEFIGTYDPNTEMGSVRINIGQNEGDFMHLSEQYYAVIYVEDIRGNSAVNPGENTCNNELCIAPIALSTSDAGQYRANKDGKGRIWPCTWPEGSLWSETTNTYSYSVNQTINVSGSYYNSSENTLYYRVFLGENHENMPVHIYVKSDDFDLVQKNSDSIWAKIRILKNERQVMADGAEGRLILGDSRQTLYMPKTKNYANPYFAEGQGENEGDYTATGTCGTNLNWYFYEDIGLLTIKGTGEMTNYSLPSYVPWARYKNSISTVYIYDGVTSIGNYAFYNCTGLTSVTIPDSVTSIGNSAFNGCTGLTSVIIPDSVTSIGYKAFLGCSGLTSITVGKNNTIYHSVGNCLLETSTGKLILGNNNSVIPNDGSVTSIGDGAFYGCAGITSVTIPDSVTSIGDYVFSGCSGLESITVDDGNTVYHSSGDCLVETESKILIAGCKNSVIPTDDSVTSIGNAAFSGCTGLTSVTIGNSVTSIGNYAFYNCTGLTSVTIPDSVTSIGDAAFCRCYGLTSITIPDSVTSIGNDAFLSCKSLTSVTIPDSVTSIGDSAFLACSGLTSITIPDSVTSIGDDAFCWCSGLTSITVGKNNTVYHSKGNCLIETATGKLILGSNNSVIPNDGSVTSIGHYAFDNCTGLTSITIPDSVTSIGDYAFCECDFLTSVTISDGVTSIGDDAFIGCDNLTSVTIGNSVTSIGDGAFYGCDNLTSVTIPDSVTSIGDYAFQCCRGLTSVTIGNSVTSIGEYAFYDCTGLKDVYYAGSESDRKNISIGGYNDYLINATWHYNSTGPDDIHSHSYNSDWQKDSLTHWNVCDCGEKGNTAAHTFNSETVTKPATTENTGVKTLTCTVCGYKKMETIPKISISDLPETNAIKGNSANNQKTYNYKTSVTFTANVPEGGSVQWYIDGKKAGTDSTLTVKASKNSYTVTVVVTDKNGEQTMDEEKVTIKNSFFDKLIWFFVHLFNPGAYDIKQ